MDEKYFEEIRLYLPKYLSPAKIDELYSEIKSFPDIPNHYFEYPEANELLQGDGWRGFVSINFETVEKQEVSGIIISNSCDIDINNPRDNEPNVLFAPISSLGKYENILAATKSEEQVSNIIRNIKEQKITNIFYLPQFNEDIGDCIIVLDDIKPHPLRNFIDKDKSRLFSLQQTFFYLFLMKLSIHFSRFNEGVERF